MATPGAAGVCGLSKEVTLAVLPRLHLEELLLELGRRNITIEETYKKESLASKLWFIMVKEYQGTVHHSVIPDAPVVTVTPSASQDKAVSEQWVTLSHDLEELMETVASTGAASNFVPKMSTANSASSQVNLTQSDGNLVTVSTNSDTTGMTTTIENTDNTLTSPSSTTTTTAAVSTPQHFPSFTQEVVIETAGEPDSSKKQLTSPRRSVRLHVLETEASPSSVKNLALVGKAEETYQDSGDNAAAKEGQATPKRRKGLRAMAVTREEHRSVGSNAVVTESGAVMELVGGAKEDSNNTAQESEDEMSSDEDDADVPMDDDDDPDWEPESPMEERELGSTKEVVSPGVLTSPHSDNTTMDSEFTAHHQPIKCPECDFTTDSKSKMLHHMTSHDKTRHFVCKECGYRASRKERLTEHMNIHTSENPFVCHKCGFSTKTYSSFRSHLAMHNRAKSYVCDKCDFSSVNKAVVVRHSKIHEGKHPYQCPHCEFKAKTAIDLSIHLGKHSASPTITCDLCGYIAKTQERLELHLREHEMEEKLHRCTSSGCEFSTPNYQQYKRHMSTHATDRPFACPECSYRAKKKTHLAEHMRVHTGERPFKCSFCPYSAMARHHLQHHEMKHKKNLMLKCNVCGLTLQNRDMLEKHQKMHEAHRVFKNQNNSKEEDVTVTHQCSHCEFSTSDAHELYLHMVKHIHNDHVEVNNDKDDAAS